MPLLILALLALALAARLAAHGPLDLVGDIEIFGPDGKSLLAKKKCCRYSVADRSGLRFAMLSYVLDLTMDATDPKGMYTMRSSVTDGKQTVARFERRRPELFPRRSPQLSRAAHAVGNHSLHGGKVT